MSAFARMEAKADQMLDQANAMSELNAQPADSAANLEKKYAEAGNTESVDADQGGDGSVASTSFPAPPLRPATPQTALAL